MRFYITEAESGTLIRDFIRQALKPSSKMLKYLKYRADGILVNGEHQTVRYVLRAGDVLDVAVDDGEASEKVAPVNLPLEILYEDDDLIIPSKPAQMPTHPSHDHYRDTVANALAYLFANRDIPFVFRPINRLDRNTSGLLLIAKNKLSAGRMTRAMERGEIKKTYFAVLDGEMAQGNGVIDACLHRTAKSIIVREVCSPDAPDADPARTEYTVLLAKNGHTLVQARPITGRTHQLRVHFASLGHPIMGDDLYGTPCERIDRHALHAATLTFPHPATQERMTVTAPLAPDMKRLIDELFGAEMAELVYKREGDA